MSLSVVVTTVASCGPPLLYRVRPGDGRALEARVPKATARLMFRVVPGDRVRVCLGDRSPPRITGFDRGAHG